MNNNKAIEAINADRVEFIETLSQEFMKNTGYGVYAFISSIDVIRLFDYYNSEGLSLISFVKTYVQSYRGFND